MINYHLSNPKVSRIQIAAKFAKEYGMTHISKQTMSRIFEKDMVKKLLRTQVIHESPIKNIRECKYPELERCLFVWFSQIKHDEIITDAILIQKAKEFGEMLGINDQSFKYSIGWLDKFKKRFGIAMKTLAGESGSGNIDIVERERSRLKKILSEFKPVDRFNFDETASFYKLQPNKTLGTSTRSTSGKKQSKDCVTIGLCCNETGDQYIKPLIINKSRKPHCFGRTFNPDTIVYYYYNKNAWMTMDVFEHWLKKINNDFASKNRKIILLVDNAGRHNLSDEFKTQLTHIVVEYLAPNCTSVIQPSDAGIIRAFKAKYRSKLVRHILRVYDEKKRVE